MHNPLDCLLVSTKTCQQFLLGKLFSLLASVGLLFGCCFCFLPINATSHPLETMAGADCLALRPPEKEAADDAATLATREEATLTKAKKDMPDREHALLTLFHEAISGEWAEDLMKLAESTGADYQRLLQALETDRETEFCKKIGAACAALEEKQISSEGGAPSLSVRQLARLQSEGDEAEAERVTRAKKERDEIWAKAVAIRKKHVEIVDVSKLKKKPSTSSELKQQILGQREGNSDLGLNEAHRGIFLAADLSGEMSPPWQLSSSMTKACLTTFKLCLGAVEEMGSRECEFHFLLDGRDRESRKLMEDAFSKVPATELCEIWVSYSKTSQLGPSRKVFGFDSGREVGLVRLPCARVRLACSDREDDFTKGENTSTSDTTYEGVPATDVARQRFDFAE